MNQKQTQLLIFSFISYEVTRMKHVKLSQFPTNITREIRAPIQIDSLANSEKVYIKKRSRKTNTFP